jgi:menaquinone-dependent protoporphyrinogen IX oxidase
MKGLIIHKGKYGATAQYAKWMGEELHLPVLTPDELGSANLEDYDFLLIAGSVYVGKWMMRDWVKQHLNLLNKKRIMFIIVCGTPASQQEEQERLAKTNIPATLYGKAGIFFLPGRVDIKKLSWMDRFALKIASRMEKDPVKQKEMRQGYDRVSRQMLGEVIRRCRDIVNSKEKKVFNISM